MMDVASNKVAVAAIALAAVAVIVRFRLWSECIAVLAATVVALAASEALKDLIRRPRPPQALAIVHAGGFSMPSTDAAATAAAAIAVIAAFNWSSPKQQRVAAILLALVVAAVGLCLVYLGVYWPTDVLAGWALGLTVGWVTATGIQSLIRRLQTS